MDARFPERWLNDRRLARATDAQFRLFTNANAWAVSNRTDGLIPSAELSLIPRAITADAAGLVSLGLWAVVPAGWMIEGFLDVQTSKSQLDGLDKVRAKNAKRQREYRSRKRSTSTTQMNDGVRHLSRNDIGQDRTGSLQESSNASEGKNLEASDFSHQALLEADEAGIYPASVHSAPISENDLKQNCPDCTDPLPPDGICPFCGPRTRRASW